MTVTAVDPLTVLALQGVLAPIQDEIDAPELEVVAGAVPDDLDGAYFRNGPNARFTPLGSYTYPLDGDGMLHAVYLTGGRARYRNRYVRTPSMAAEEAAGRALWGGAMTPVMPTPDEAGPEMAGRDKDLPDINIVRHAGRYLALAEGARQFEVDPALESLGPQLFGGAFPDGFCAHPRLDPLTGELVVFRYLFEPPYLVWAVVGPDGNARMSETPIPLDRAYMVHDFVITQRYAVVFVCPAPFDFQALGRGEPVLQFRHDVPTRILVLDRERPDVTPLAIETEPFWVWHFANAFEEPPGNGQDAPTIVVDFPWLSELVLGATSHPVTHGSMRCHIDLTAGRASFERRDERTSEFPRIDDRRTGQRHRYYWAASKAEDSELGMGHWNRITRYDVETGDAVERDGKTLRYGEPAFAPRAGSDREGDGYVMTFATDVDTEHSSFVILHADDIDGDPAAVLRIPHRVPVGLHGNWFPAPL